MHRCADKSFLWIARMVYALISDIHGNLEALTAVLRDICREGVDQCICLGDIVGYGANPNECIAEVRKECDVILGGNHDWAAIGKTDIRYFNEYARWAIQWTSRVLEADSRSFLGNLPLVYRFGGNVMVHSSLVEPSQWYYVLSKQDARENFERMAKDLVCFIGHSHQPMFYTYDEEGDKILAFAPMDSMVMRRGHKFIINIGSVGQPRDGNSAACYVLYDDRAKSVSWRRVRYDIAGAQRKIRAARLPGGLADRLAYGM
ncbi:MAG: metallophosphoesterase family protein [bacterium]